MKIQNPLVDKKTSLDDELIKDFLVIFSMMMFEQFHASKNRCKLLKNCTHPTQKWYG